MSTPPNKPNLYIVGFMGTGKSSIGQRTAKLLGMEFIDSDAAIEHAMGMKVTQIFETQGEHAFREAERLFIEKGHPKNGCVIACGGGLIAQPGMHERLNQLGIVICLFARTETILERISRKAGKRPLLNDPNPHEKIEGLLHTRNPIYMRSGPSVSTDGRPQSEIAKHVARVYKRCLKD